LILGYIKKTILSREWKNPEKFSHLRDKKNTPNQYYTIKKNFEPMIARIFFIN